MTRATDLAEFSFLENDSTSGLGGLFAEKYEFVRSEKWFTFKAALNLMHQRRAHSVLLCRPLYIFSGRGGRQRGCAHQPLQCQLCQ